MYRRNLVIDTDGKATVFDDHLMETRSLNIRNSIRLKISPAFIRSIQFSIIGLISIAVPLALLLIYKAYAAKEGIVLESGCHGPELPFGMLSGILMAVQLRFVI